MRHIMHFCAAFIRTSVLHALALSLSRHIGAHARAKFDYGRCSGSVVKTTGDNIGDHRSGNRYKVGCRRTRQLPEVPTLTIQYSAV